MDLLFGSAQGSGVGGPWCRPLGFLRPPTLLKEHFNRLQIPAEVENRCDKKNGLIMGVVMKTAQTSQRIYFGHDARGNRTDCLLERSVFEVSQALLELLTMTRGSRYIIAKESELNWQTHSDCVLWTDTYAKFPVQVEYVGLPQWTLCL